MGVRRKGGRKGGQEREGERERDYHPLVHSLNGHSGCGWARPKLEARASLMGAGCQEAQPHGPCSAACSDVLARGRSGCRSVRTETSTANDNLALYASPEILLTIYNLEYILRVL